MTLTKTPCRLAVTTYRQSKINDRFQLLITKKEVDCDYVAVDATALVATGLRLAKNVTSEQRRHKEVARHVSQSLQQLLKKVRCKKSLLIAMDGSETLMKAELTRSSSVTRKIESRLMRLPGTPLMQAVEERLVRMMPDRQILPSEVVFSGTCVQGCVEQKMSAWALDLASRDSFSGSTDSLCLIGASELYLNVMALSPFYNVMSVVQNNADLRQMRLQDILEWLDLDKRAKEGESVTIAKMRTDILFLFILANGASVTELHPIPTLGFSELVDRYLKNFMEITSDNTSTDGVGGGVSPQTGTTKGELFLFEDMPGNTLRLNIPLLCRIIQLVARKEVPPRIDIASEAYLELALQTHAMLCLGEAPEFNYIPSMQTTTQTGSPVPGIIPFAAHLAAMCSTEPHRIARRTPPRVKQLTTSTNEEEKEKEEREEKEKEKEKEEKETFTLAESKAELGVFKRKVKSGEVLQPLTAAEYTILCQSLPASVETLIQHYVGVAPKPEVGKMITSSDTTGAHRMIREVLSYANPLKPHKCLCLSPSYCWLQNEKTQLWRFEYVDIGVKSHQMETRRHLNAVKGVTLEVNMSRDGPSYFLTSTSSWEPITKFPCGAEEEKHESKQKETTSTSIEEGIKDMEESSKSIKSEDDTNNKKDKKKTIVETVDKSKDKELSEESHSTESQTIKTKTTTDKYVSSKQSTLKLLTWNVMFDRYSGKPTPLGMPGIDWCSPKRYPVLAKLIQQEDADVVGMQEVEPVFWNFLSKQSWVRENYFFSCGYASPAITPWGVLMLVHRRRLSIQNITYLNVPAWTNHVSLMPVVTLEMPHGSVHVAAAHLLAPYTKSHETARTSQDGALRHHMIKTLSGDVVTMGDFNDWPTSEFHMPSESQYVDCWPLLHPGNPGKTMDETNTFCKLKVEEMFFGRSDKVFLRSRRLVPVEAHLVGTKSVNDENGNNEAPAYLFPSDHYGVSMTFKLKQR